MADIFRRVPPPADQDAADRLLQRWRERCGPPGDGLARLLACLGGNSPYLAELALREASTLIAIQADGIDAVCDAAVAALRRVAPASERPAVAGALRLGKRRVALCTAIADLAGLWDLGRVITALSELADAALSAATAHLLDAARRRGELTLPHPADPARGSGFAVLGMGKLGARELNYSSDVDLILLYDPEAHPQRADQAGAIFTRLARELVALMQTRDADGYVFRTDLRLRPDPAATPLAVSLPGALSYYESLAQTWERAAMIKARPVAGDLALGQEFLASIRPFVWRRHLDFAAIADIRAMKQRIDTQRGDVARRPLGAPSDAGDAIRRLLGRNLKLGEGGIREIEFTAQTLQLVWGGRQPALRAPGTRAALAVLAEEGRLPQPMATALDQAYCALRRAEHRLQMVDDRQTHSLPDQPDAFARFAVFLGAPDAASCATELLHHSRQVHVAFTGLLSAPLSLPDAAPATVLEPPTAASVVFRDQDSAMATVAGWRAGRPRALRSERARALLEALLPALLSSLAGQGEPDLALARFDTLLARLPAGVQLLSLLHHNPALLARLAAVLGAAPMLADHLAAVPAALEGLLAPNDVDPEPAVTLAQGFGGAASLDEALVALPRLVRGEEFRLALAEMEGRIDADHAGAARTALAEAVISIVLPLVRREHRRRYGRLPGGGLAVVALGKAGSREMMAGSDLDLMLIYDHGDQVAESSGDGGARRIPASQYFARMAQALVAALTAPTAQGRLYDVDMRLRPSGSKGPVAVSLASFRQYHGQGAWTWERMALTRARVVAGPPGLRRRVGKAIRDALRLPQSPATVLADAVAMRRRMLRDLPPRGPWDVKLRPGGLVEVEFIGQALQLLQPSRPGLLQQTTHLALAALAEGGLITRGDADLLIRADRLWRSVLGLLAITVGRSPRPGLPHLVVEALARVIGLRQSSVDEADLAAALDLLALQVREAFVRLLGNPEDQDHATG